MFMHREKCIYCVSILIVSSKYVKSSYIYKFIIINLSQVSNLFKIYSLSLSLSINPRKFNILQLRLLKQTFII